MVRAWYLDDSQSNWHQSNMTDPPRFVEMTTVKELSGVLYFKLDADRYVDEGKLQRIREERKYTYEDQIEMSREKLPNYDQLVKAFFTEHLHDDEEIRFILGGSGYFDIRDRDDKWIRIEAVKGDLIILPAGIYHRFTLDTENYIKAMRLFAGDPVWTAYNRPEADALPARARYLESMGLQCCKSCK